MKCEKCGKLLDSVELNVFQFNGSDVFQKEYFHETPIAIKITTEPNWTGYELTDEERLDTIRCPHCKQFPFKNSNIVTFSDDVSVILFKDKSNTTSRKNRIQQMDTNELANFLQEFMAFSCNNTPLNLKDWLNEELQKEEAII
ncbi:MAG: hypothetical protein ACI37Z_04975 [Candidatus Gastranaerophilaceae bacterium]